MPFVVTLLFSAVAILYGSRIVDYFSARTFTPSAEVAAIRDSLSLTDEASDIFYASRPSVQDSEQFNKSCNSSERTAAILGCYYLRSIYIYNITNTELVGAKTVSAAHEMLHAAYERLNFIDKSRVDAMLQVEYAKLKDDTEVAKLMTYYKQAEPSDLLNELHSILGTTVASLSPELEAYYGRYFKDRQKIVQLNSNYNAVFSSVESQANELSSKIDALGATIKSRTSAYSTVVASLNNDIATFNKRAQTGYYTSTWQFNNDKYALEVRINSVNNERTEINAQITEYNGYVAELEKLSVKAEDLNKSINGINLPEVTL